ncbi:MAG: ABC transporter permease [Candidatus Cloacimonetes bacterium]|nr:ABC transporter permease [Candidatus Cloacimonadota bacterium]
MHLNESTKSSLQNILSHKLRSLLTLLGIIIGVFAVVTMFSTVYGLKNLINERMEGMGWNNSIIIYPSAGQENTSTLRLHRIRRLRRENKPLTLDDYSMLRAEVESKYIYGMIESYERYYSGTRKNNVQLRATNRDFFLTQTYVLATGRYFNDFENSSAAKVCVIGHFFAEQYFPGQDPLGQFIKVGDNRYQVVGVLAGDKLNEEGMNFNLWQRRQDLRAVYIPLSTGARYLRTANAIDYIYIQAENEAAFRIMRTETYQKLLAQHKMAHDFSFNDVGALMFKITQELEDMMQKWNITLSAIASISLIVGGIGLFSTLLISINERMLEIGVRKSIGATEMDIFLHFILEAIILALLGALIGISISTILIKLVSTALKASFPIPLAGIALGLGFSLFIGFLSGIYPAWKASRIDPIKAIYYFE